MYTPREEVYTPAEEKCIRLFNLCRFGSWVIVPLTKPTDGWELEQYKSIISEMTILLGMTHEQRIKRTQEGYWRLTQREAETFCTALKGHEIPDFALTSN